MINDKSRDLAKLRNICNNPESSPERRLRAAGEGLIRFGCTQRWTPIVKRLIRTFEDFQDPSATKTKLIREMVDQLETNLKSAMRTKAVEQELEEEGERDEAELSTSASSSETSAAEPEPEPVAPHQLIANPKAIDPAILAGIDTSSMFDWHHLRTDLQPIIGLDLKALDMSPASTVIVPHPKMLEALFDLFEPDLPQQDHHDPYYRARKIESCWYFPFGEKEFNAAEQRLKTAPWLEFAHQPGEPPRICVTEAGERKRFLELLRARVAAGRDVYGRPRIDNGSL